MIRPKTSVFCWRCGQRESRRLGNCCMDKQNGAASIQPNEQIAEPLSAPYSVRRSYVST